MTHNFIPNYYTPSWIRVLWLFLLQFTPLKLFHCRLYSLGYLCFRKNIMQTEKLPETTFLPNVVKKQLVICSATGICIDKVSKSKYLSFWNLLESEVTQCWCWNFLLSHYGTV